jgi:hypothetical protein
VAERGAVTGRIAKLVAEDLDEEALARMVCQACVDDLDVDGAAISVLPTEPSRRTLWATDETSLALEDLQFTLNEGVCVEAATSGVPVLVSDLARTTGHSRWPVFAAEVAERTPAKALYALPLHWGAVTIGVLDLYRLRAGEFSTVQWQDLLGVAEVAALLLLRLRTRPGSARAAAEVLGDGARHDDLLGTAGVDGDGRGNSGHRRADTAHRHDNDGQDGRDEALSDGVFGRPEIHQAVGMVLVQLGIGPEEALARMRAWAYFEQRMLIDVARDVVERRLVFTEEMR